MEVTETVAVRYLEIARDVLGRLRSAGVAVSIDDFDTGQSSMAQLHSLPVDEVKIDALFVRGLPAVRDVAIIRAINSIADEFDLDVVAEGVETDEQLAALRDCSINLVQGFLPGAPMPADDLIALLAQQVRGPLMTT